VVYILGFVGWIIEGTITGLIVSYVYRVRPGLVTGEHAL
jgi:ABC-type Co2+ transport system permease subunit